LSSGSRQKGNKVQPLTLPQESRPVLIRSTRIVNGRVVGLEEYDRMGMIPADNLNPQKARILLMLALTKTHDLREIKRMFDEY
jgi:L-asparaginase